MSVTTLEREQAKNKWNNYKQTMKKDIDIFDIARVGDVVHLKEILTILNRNHDALAIDAWINSKNSKGHSPLMLAIYNNNLEIAEYLITQGADVNSEDFNGNTILMGAAFKGNTLALELLIQNGARISSVNYNNLSAEDWAVMFGRTKAVKLLKQYTPHEASSQSNRLAIGLKYLKSFFQIN